MKFFYKDQMTKKECKSWLVQQIWTAGSSRSLDNFEIVIDEFTITGL